MKRSQEYFRDWQPYFYDTKIKNNGARSTGYLVVRTDLPAQFGQPQLNLDGAAEHLAERDVHLLDAGGGV